MYFPYLYSRQAELNALSDVADTLGSPQLVYPIIEPVEPASKLIAALSNLKTHGASAYVVTNPHQGKLRTAAAFASWSTDFSGTLSDTSLVRPTLKETPATTLADVKHFVGIHAARKLGIVLSTSRISPSDLAAAVKGTDYIIFFLPTVGAANYIAALSPVRTVDISDNFRSEARNMDYSGEEWLANNHVTWKAGGRGGFSDFTMLPGTYSDGGGPVGAIAIHLTLARGVDLWIQHFVSATNGQTDPQATKFREVLFDIHNQRVLTPARFKDSPGLRSYEAQRTSGNFTNLSGNKRQQISHHIYTVAKLLGV